MANPLKAKKPGKSVDAAVSSLAAQVRQFAHEIFGSQVDNAKWWRDRLLGTISRVITAERVKGIREAHNAADIDARVDDLANSVAKAIHGFFDPFNLRKAISRKGRKREFAERDQKMLTMRKQGLRLSQIARIFRAKGQLASSNPGTDAQTVGSALARSKNQEQGEGEAVALCEQISVLLHRLRAMSPPKSGSK